MNNFITKILDTQSDQKGVLPLIARAIFASTLFLFFWNSAMTKFDGLFTPSLGAYAQIFPKSFEAVGYDPSAMNLFHKLLALGAGYGEIILPILIILGLLTRPAALGMIVFIIVMSVVDITGHHVDPGAFFDGKPMGIIADQRLFWVFLLLVLTVCGGGGLSLDRLISKRF